jgi:hypothetical protein
MPTIPLTQGQRARVDWCDYRELSQYRWCVVWSKNTRSFYAVRGVSKDGKWTSEIMHRRILGLTPGDGLQVDHINHQTLDNRRRNIRIVTSRENHENRRDQSRFGPGIYLRRRGGIRPFQVQARVNGRLLTLGDFATAEEAREARRKFLKDLS